MASFGTQLDDYKGFGPGFDFVRVFLALGIAAWHAIQIAQGNLNSVHATPLWFIDYSFVTMFFALSGFLVAGSSLRLSLPNFLINRALRIIPALAVEILFSALLLGTIFTTLSLKKYFSSLAFWHYMTNIVGAVNYYLPGVFENNPNDRVNAVLWTVPYEIGCYIILAALIALGLLRRPAFVALVTAILLLLALAVDLSSVLETASLPAQRTLIFLFLDSGAKLWPVFLMGVVAYLWRARIPYHAGLFFGAVGVCVTLSVVGNITWFGKPFLHIIALPCLVYIVVFLGLTPIPRLPLFHRGDYSYGIYLYHWPLMQAILAAFPGTSALSLFAVMVPALTAFSAFSWHLIEKPILAQRRKFSFVAQAKQFGEHESGQIVELPATG